MLKKTLFGGILASTIGVHLIQTKETKEIIRKYCPVFTKCCKENKKKK